MAAWPQIAAAQVSWNLYDPYTKTYTIDYVNTPAVTPGVSGAILVQLSVGGGTTAHFEIDTGSAGTVVPIALIPNFVPTGQPVIFGYASSGNYSRGTWSTQTVTFPDSNDGSGNLATATVPVFVAQHYTTNGVTYDCATEPNSCAHMMGVGFGRPDAGQTGYHPSLDSNPLLHFAGMDEGTVRAGYVITPYGIQAGLTAQNAGSGFSYVQLQPAVGPTAPNWQTTPGTVVVNGNAAVSTEVLIDTGINYMWGTLYDQQGTDVPCPGDPQFQCAPNNTKVSVFFGGTQGVGYTFTVGDAGNPDATPIFVRTDAAGMNTGIHPVSSFTYMFDAVGGFMGLKAVDPSQPGIAFAPYLSTMGDFDLPAGFGTNLGVYARGASTISAAGDALFTGSFTGPGALEFDGPGDVTLAGTVTLPSGVTVSGGSVTFGAAVVAPMTVGSAGTVTNQVSLTGSVNNSGTFSNDGTVTGAFTNNGVLAGNGTIIGDVTNNAFISPGHSIGVVNVVGNVAFAPGSYYVAEIDAGGVSDQIIATGAVTINDATLYLVPLPTWVPTFGTYQFITAGGGASGTFNVVSPTLGSATSLYPFLDAITASTPTGVSVEIVRSDVAFAEVASTTNQLAVAGMLDDLPAASPFLPLVSMLTGPQARAAFDGMSGEIYASAQSVLQQQSITLRSTLNERLRAASGNVSATTDLATAAIAPGYNATVWINGYGGWGSTDATANSASVDRSAAGFIAGLDVPLNEVWSLGLAGGYGSTSFDIDTLASSGDIDSYDLALYAGGKWGALGLRGGVSHSWSAVSVSRTVAFSGFVEGESADYDAGTTQVFGEVGYELAYGAAKFEPFAGLAYVAVSSDGFTEQGGVAALTGESSDQDNTYSTLGIRVSAYVPVAKGQLAVRGLLGWQHAFGNVTPGTAMDLAGEGGGFTVFGAPIDENALLLGAGLDYLLNASLRLSLAYEGQIGSNANDNAVKASLNYRF